MLQASRLINKNSTIINTCHNPQKLALTSPTGGGRSVGIVRVRTKATEFSFSLVCHNQLNALYVYLLLCILK